MSNELTVRHGSPVALGGGADPNRIAGLVRMLADTQGRSPAEALSILAVGECAGLSLGESLTQVHMIAGKPTLNATMQLSLARRAGVRSRWVESTATVATLRLWVPGDPDPVDTSYTDAEARAAGHLDGRNKGTWSAHRAAMLRARCITTAIRMHCPEVLGGAVYDAVELDQVEYITPAASSAPPVDSSAPRTEPAPKAHAEPPAPPVWQPLRALAALEGAGFDRAMLESELAFGAPAEEWPETMRDALLGLLTRRRKRTGSPAAVVESSTEPGTYWLVMREAGDVVTCDCPAGRHGKACHHAEVVGP